jgi:hypothetical protein
VVLVVGHEDRHEQGEGLHDLHEVGPDRQEDEDDGRGQVLGAGLGEGGDVGLISNEVAQQVRDFFAAHALDSLQGIQWDQEVLVRSPDDA